MHSQMPFSSQTYLQDKSCMSSSCWTIHLVKLGVRELGWTEGSVLETNPLATLMFMAYASSIGVQSTFKA